MSNTEKNALREKASAALKRHRPDYLIDTVADLLTVLEEIEQRLAKGEAPDVSDARALDAALPAACPERARM